MKKFALGNTVLGILLGMLGGIGLTSALAWFIFKDPPAFVDRNQVVARDLKLPANTVEELLAAQRRTGNPDAAITLNGYRVRTNIRREIFVAPIPAPGAKPQPEVQVIRRMPVNGVSNKQNFEFYEILEQRHQPVIPTPIAPIQEPIVRNSGNAPLTIYPAEQAEPAAVHQPLVTIAPPTYKESVNKPVAQPFSSNRAAPSATAPNRVVSPATQTQPVKTAIAPAPKPVTTPAKPTTPTTAEPVETKLVFLEVDFFTDYDEAAKLQQKLLEKGLPVRLKEEKVLKKRAGYKVFVGPYDDKKSLTSAKAKLQALGLRASAQNQ